MASVTFKRGTRAEIEATAKQDGQILMETDQTNNKMYVDLPDNNRVRIGNSNVDDISGITDSLTATSSNIALSAAGGNNLQGQIDTLNSSLSSKVNSDHFIIAGGLKLPSSSEGLIYKKDYLVGYLPIASITKVYGQYRSNIFDVALSNDGSVHGVNIPSSAYGAECIILFVKNEPF